MRPLASQALTVAWMRSPGAYVDALVDRQEDRQPAVLVVEDVDLGPLPASQVEPGEQAVHPAGPGDDELERDLVLQLHLGCEVEVLEDADVADQILAAQPLHADPQVERVPDLIEDLLGVDGRGPGKRRRGRAAHR